MMFLFYHCSSTSVFTSAVSEGVSVAGVLPSMIVRPTSLPTTPPPPPTCGRKYPEKVRSEKQHEVHFEGDDSVVALNVNRSLINEMAERYYCTKAEIVPCARKSLGFFLL